MTGYDVNRFSGITYCQITRLRCLNNVMAGVQAYVTIAGADIVAYDDIAQLSLSPEKDIAWIARLSPPDRCSADNNSIHINASGKCVDDNRTTDPAR